MTKMRTSVHIKGTEKENKDRSRLPTHNHVRSESTFKRKLKRFTNKAVLALTNILNPMLRLWYFPQRWIGSEVIVIVKTLKHNYRSISLLPVINKIIGSIMVWRLEEHIKEVGIHLNEQFEVLSHHPTNL